MKDKDQNKKEGDKGKGKIKNNVTFEDDISDDELKKEFSIIVEEAGIMIKDLVSEFNTRT